MPRNEKFGTAPFAICHWDTFEEEDGTFLVGEAQTLEEAVENVMRAYKGRLEGNGADRVDIVDLEGKVVQSFKVS